MIDTIEFKLLIVCIYCTVFISGVVCLALMQKIYMIYRDHSKRQKYISVSSEHNLNIQSHQYLTGTWDCRLMDSNYNFYEFTFDIECDHRNKTIVGNCVDIPNIGKMIITGQYNNQGRFYVKFAPDKLYYKSNTLLNIMLKKLTTKSLTLIGQIQLGISSPDASYGVIQGKWSGIFPDLCGGWYPVGTYHLQKINV